MTNTIPLDNIRVWVKHAKISGIGGKIFTIITFFTLTHKGKIQKSKKFVSINPYIMTIYISNMETIFPF
jgi:hypothetical protein